MDIISPDQSQSEHTAVVDPLPVDDFVPIFYVGHHESGRSLPISEPMLRQAQDVGYDMLTTPITTLRFHSRVLSILSSYLSSWEGSESEPPAPVIPPFDSGDTPLSPGDPVAQLIGYTSPWIDICSPDPLISNISRQVLIMEVAYAGFCGLGNIIIQGPRLHGNSPKNTAGLIQFARAIQEALTVGNYVQVAIQIPMYFHKEAQEVNLIADLALFARDIYSVPPHSSAENDIDIYGTWDAWNVIRSVCKYNPKLSVALNLPRQLPAEALQLRWFAEPLRYLCFNASVFLRNKGGHPVLSKGHQSLITRYMRLKQSPWILLCDVGPIPDYGQYNRAEGGFSSLDSVDISGLASPTPTEAAEASEQKQVRAQRTRLKDLTAHLIYIRYLQRHQPPRSTIEKFGSGYQDYLQAPLQPLTDNLESVTYEVFEKDPVKYELYEKAVSQALTDWIKQQKPASGPNGAVVIAVVGSGRGPLVTRALRASSNTGVKIEVWALEKNPNAYVLLQRHNNEDWNGVVNIVKSDMRTWRGPVLQTSGSTGPETQRYGKVDILVSELLGSFADNELSPECLDGVQHVLASPHGISIPSSYTAHLTPILAPRLHSDISQRVLTDPMATETPYVVMLHAIDYVATSVPDHPRFQQAWEFVHPLSAGTKTGNAGDGGSVANEDGANEHNTRHACLKFVCKDRGVVNGIAGYFEAVLYNGGVDGGLVELSTRPDTIDEKSKDMISWFPIYFPLKSPLYFPDDAELEVSMWRQTDNRKVWYEWMIEAFAMIGPTKRMRVGMSEIGSSRKNGCLM